ncbi:MAG: hypothetical protein A3C43_04330 [Candidatus Schekmanbacteria bacterium RIFCSPHIGHO2_02_FULL_38_11]|nr:MAG: hypothetical protein A3C43_04330 [Candidatus Schekmanbacteria bacterium RIFCSPHIGHO2_02_FULL_38_11]
MSLLNSIVNNPYFKQSSLHASFSECPLGFIDIGALGGVHSLISPVASLVHYACFEPAADALYFKDPFDPANKNRNFFKRNIEVLLLTAILTYFYDFALEIVECYYTDKTDSGHIRDLVLSMAAIQSKTIENSLNCLLEDDRTNPSKTYLLAKKFIDKYKSNNDVDFIIEV